MWRRDVAYSPAVDPEALTFFTLTPERVLDAVEVDGRRATGRCMALNSLENRVYEVELEDDSKLVAKFYRPGRWSTLAILDEHAFLRELAEAELPVVPPIEFSDGKNGRSTLGLVEGIRYALFPKVRGRVPEELADAELEQYGRLLARLHNVGDRARATHRPTLDPATYGTRSLEILLRAGVLPPDLEPRYAEVARTFVTLCERHWPTDVVRLHGDCHLGNLLHGRLAPELPPGPFLLDFDDFLNGPAVQDLWLLSPGRDDDARRAREVVAEAYREMRTLPSTALRWVEPLRGLRILRYAAWIAERWADPAFQRAFPDYESRASWQRELSTLEEQLSHSQEALGSSQLH